MIITGRGSRPCALKERGEVAKKGLATRTLQHRPPALKPPAAEDPAPGRLSSFPTLLILGPSRSSVIDLCITNRHCGHKKAGSSEAVMKDRRSSGRFRAFLVIRHSAAMSPARLSGRALASVALKWVQTNSSGFRSGA